MKRFSLSFLAGMFLVAVTFSAALAGPRVAIVKGDADLAKETAAAFSLKTVIAQPYDWSKPVTREMTLTNDYNWDAESEAAIEKLVREAIKLSGDFPNVAGKSVFIKPNLVYSVSAMQAAKFYTSEQMLSVVTDPRVCRAVGLVALENGARKVMIGETPATGDPYATLKGLGYEKVTKELDKKYPGKAELVDTKLCGYKWYTPPTTGGLALAEYAIPTALIDADVFISVPKMKTHSMAGVTLSMKNVGIGAPSVSVYGQGKLGLPHGRLAEEIVDVCDIVGIDYAVVDAIVGMEGSGPVAGKPVHMNTIIAGKDCVAVDWVGAELMGYKGDSIGTVRLGQKMKLGTFKNVEVVGMPIKDAMVQFEPVPRADRSPGIYTHNVGWGPDAVAK